MATQLQIRRGTATQVAAFTGAEGEIVVNTTNDSVHVNDGSTQGGFELARVDGANWNVTNNISTTGSVTAASLVVDTTTLVVDATNNMVGIGNSSPSSQNTVFKVVIGTTSDANTGSVLVSSSSGSGWLGWNDANNASIPAYIKYEHSNDSMLFQAASAERMRLTSTGLGIGTSSITNALGWASITQVGGANPALSLKNSSDVQWDIANFGGTFVIYNGSNNRFKIDSSGHVGFGTSSPDATIHAAGTQASGDVPFIFENAGTSGVATASLVFAGNGGSGAEKARIKSAVFGDGYMAFHNNDDSEKMRILADGTFLVGKTADDNSVGFKTNTSSTYMVASGQTPAFINRLSNDGDVLEFRKDSSAVGSIGTVDADLTVFSKASGHKGLRFGNGYIAPTNNAGTIEDNSTDLGLSTHRFQDLYLSGGAYLGGTTSANYLDDYEEGSFTPALNGFTGSYIHQIGQYRKVGGLVTAAIHIHISSTGGSGDIIVTGLPFTQTSSNRYGGATAIHCNLWATTTKPDNALVNPGTTNAAFYKMQGQTGLVTPQLSDMGTGNLLCVFVYMTAQ